jgi:hypothetical protein
MAQVTHLIPEEVTIIQVEGETRPVEPMKEHIRVFQVFFPRLGVDYDVVELHEADLPREASEGDVDKHLEGCRRVLEPKGLSRKRIYTFVRNKVVFSLSSARTGICQ